MTWRECVTSDKRRFQDPSIQKFGRIELSELADGDCRRAHMINMLQVSLEFGRLSDATIETSFKDGGHMINTPREFLGFER